MIRPLALAVALTLAAPALACPAGVPIAELETAARAEGLVRSVEVSAEMVAPLLHLWNLANPPLPWRPDGARMHEWPSGLHVVFTIGDCAVAAMLGDRARLERAVALAFPEE